MREILFRGKLANGEWAYGNLKVSLKGVAIITPDDTVIGKYGQVDPETVGQYTGKTDINGVKIFEGDIVRFGRKGRTLRGREIVQWDENKAMFVFDDGCQFYGYVEEGWGYQFYEYEVIGNIHEEVTP